MSVGTALNKGSMKHNYMKLLIISVMVIPALFLLDIPVRQAARDLVGPDPLYIPELFTHCGLYLFYVIFGAILIAGSRVFVSSHYPSDVAAGMAMGIMGAWFFISRTQRPAH